MSTWCVVQPQHSPQLILESVAPGKTPKDIHSFIKKKKKSNVAGATGWNHIKKNINAHMTVFFSFFFCLTREIVFLALDWPGSIYCTTFEEALETKEKTDANFWQMIYRVMTTDGGSWEKKHNELAPVRRLDNILGTCQGWNTQVVDSRFFSGLD